MVGLRWHALGLAAPSGVARLLLIGAVASHRRAADTIKETTPALVALVITAAYLAAATLRA